MKKITYLLAILWIFIATLLLLSSCSPQKRLARLVKHHPELMRIDTVTVKDTVTVPSMQADTFFTMRQQFDTIRVNHDSIQLLIVKRHDTIWFSAKTDTFKITHDIKVPYPVIKNVVEKENTYRYITWAFIIILVLYFLYRIIAFFKAK